MDWMDDEQEPTAWPEQPGEYRDLDTAMRCPICHDFFDTPKSLKCGHSFCHTCIASNLEFQTKAKTQGRPQCPKCRAEADAMDLRVNHDLMHIARMFQAARPALLQAVRAQQDGTSAAAAAATLPSTSGAHPSEALTTPRAAAPPAPSAPPVLLPSVTPHQRSALRRKRSRASSSSAKVVTVDVTPSSSEAGSDADSDFTPTRRRDTSARRPQGHPSRDTPARPVPRGPPPGQVECPICSGFFPQGAVAQRHVEICLVRPAGTTASGAAGVGAAGSGLPAPASGTTSLKKLPKVVFKLMKASQLTESLRKCGLPTATTDGKRAAPRETLERRYTELRHAVDRALDNREPLSLEDLVRKVMMAEKQLVSAKKLSAFAPKFNSSAGQQRSEDNSHAALIEKMQSRKPGSREHKTAGESKQAEVKGRNEACKSDPSTTPEDETVPTVSTEAVEECVVIDDSDVVADSDDEMEALGMEEGQEEMPISLTQQRQSLTTTC